MLKEERKKRSKKSWGKPKRQTNNWSGRGDKNRLSDYDEVNSPRIRKEKKNNRIDWQEILMEDEYDLNDG